MKNQKILNLLNSSQNEFSKFSKKKWCVIDSEAKVSYSHHEWIKFLTKSIWSKLKSMHNLIEYSDIYSDTSGSFWGFKRDEVVINVDLTNVIMLLHLNIKQLLLIILKRWKKMEYK